MVLSQTNAFSVTGEKLG